MSDKVLRCQCPECHCTEKIEELTEVETTPSNASPARVDSLKDIRYLESKLHLKLCSRCYSGEHRIF